MADRRGQPDARSRFIAHARPVRLDVRGLRAGHVASGPATSSSCSPRTPSPAASASADGPAVAVDHVPLHQPADRALLRRGRRAGRHAGHPPHRRPPGPGLGGQHDRAALRGADGHEVHRHAPAAAARADLGVLGRPRRRARSSTGRSTPTTRARLPLEPFLGTVGVAPAAREARNVLVPEAFGGNMDTPEARAGDDDLPRASTSRAPCSRSGTATTRWARARSAASRSKARWTSC